MPVTRHARVRYLLMRNPMRRNIDRLEGYLSLALAAVLIAGSAAVMWGTGSLIYRATSPHGDAAGRPALATVLSITTVDRPLTMYSATATALAQWNDPAGNPHQGQITVPLEATAGETSQIWVTGTGELTGRPPSTSDRAITAIVIALIAGSLMAAAVGGLATVAHREFDKVRLAGWEREWRLIEPLWCRR